MRRSLRIAGRRAPNMALPAKKTRANPPPKSNTKRFVALQGAKVSQAGTPSKEIVATSVKQALLEGRVAAMKEPRSQANHQRESSAGVLPHQTASQQPTSSYPCKTTVRQSCPPPPQAGMQQSGFPAQRAVSQHLGSQVGGIPPQMENQKMSSLQATALPQQGAAKQAGFLQQRPFLRGPPPRGAFPSPASHQAGTSQAGLSAQSSTQQACSPMQDRFPLGWHLTQTVKEKIWNGDYVDLFSLPQDLSHDGVFEDPREQRWTDWTCGYTIYMSVATEQDSSKALVLLKYFDIIHRAYMEYFGWGWLNYDEFFRKSVGKNAHHLWGVINLEWWVLLVLPGGAVPGERSDSGHLIVRNTDDRAQIASAGQRVQSPRVCYVYNDTGHCTKENCRYSHVCIACYAEHPFCSCPRLRKSKKRKSRQ